MSYFGTQLGQRPAGAPDTQAPAEAALGQSENLPYFAAQLGACPAPPIARGRESTAERLRADGGASASSRGCPLCRAALEDIGGIHRCTGRCGGRWLEREGGQLIDLAALPLGVCACCRPPQPLVRGEPGAICPISGQAYLLLPAGPVQLAAAAPQGICRCCDPPAPLRLEGNGLACSAKPYQHYQRQGDQLVSLKPVAAATPAATLAAIDEALRQNSAHVVMHGLFDLD